MQHPAMLDNAMLKDCNTPASRREAVAHIRVAFEASERAPKERPPHKVLGRIAPTQPCNIGHLKEHLVFQASYDNVFIPHSTSQWRIYASSYGASDGHDDLLKYYIEKLLKAFPDEPWRGHYYARNVIAPRFTKIWLHMYLRASRYSNHDKMFEYATKGLESLSGHFRPDYKVF